MVDDNYKNTSDDLWQNTSDDKWASIILDVFNLYHQNISTKLSIVVNKGLVLKYSLLDLYSNNLDLFGAIEQYISPNNSLFYNYLSILNLLTTDIENRFVDTEDDHWISTEDDKWYGNIFLSVDNSILKNYISIISLQIEELNLNIINSIHNNIFSISNLIRNRYLESNRSLHNQYTQDLGLLPRGLYLDNKNIIHDHYTRNFLELAFGFGLEVVRSLHDNYSSSNSNLLRERYLSVFNSLLNFYSSIFDLIYYKLLNILNTIHNNNSIVDLNLKLEKLLLTDKTLHEQFANNISVFLAGIADLSIKNGYHNNLSSYIDITLFKIIDILSNILENDSSIVQNIISKGIVVKDSYHDNYENIINIILRDLVISSINCVNDLINDVVENEIDISIVVDNILNEIFSSNNNLDVQLSGSIGLIIFDSIISMYSGKSVLTVTEIATLYNFIAKNTLYNFIAKKI